MQQNKIVDANFFSIRSMVGILSEEQTTAKFMDNSWRILKENLFQ